MKLYRLCCLILIMSLSMVLTGCKEYGEKRIVKLITIDKENVALYYYDYSAEKPSYLVEQVPNNGIENSMTELLSQNNYDLKLCQFAVCDEQVITSDINGIFFALTNSKFSPHISVVTGEKTDDFEKYIDYPIGSYPLFTYTVEDNNITGIVENVDTKTKKMIIKDNIYTEISADKSFVLDILTGKTKNGIYTFENNDKKFSAVLQNLNSYCYVKNGILNVRITGIIQSYKGMASNENAKTNFEYLLNNHIKNNAELLFNDSMIAESMNLLWYKNISAFNSVKIITEIK